MTVPVPTCRCRRAGDDVPVTTCVNAVVFDWGGTLTPWHTIDPHEPWVAYAVAYDPAHGDDVAAALREAEDAAWRLTLKEHRSSTLEAVVRAAGLDPSGPAHQRAVRAYQAWWEPHTYTDPDVVPLFRRLRERGVRVGVLSNTVWPRGHHEEVFRRDGVLDLIDGAVYTSEIAWTKPHPESFRAALHAVGVDDPTQAVFVGDRPFDDVHGAKSVGMRAVLVPHSVIPAEQEGIAEHEADAVVDRLADVLGLVDAWRAQAARQDDGVPA